jgi:hypothetical protein
LKTGETLYDISKEGAIFVKKILYIFSLIVIAMVVFNVPYHVKSFEHEYKCIKFTVGDDSYESVDVSINGTISKYLRNKDDVIRYNLYIDGVEYPNKNHENIYPYIPKTEDTASFYTEGNGNLKLHYKPTTQIERKIVHRQPYKEFQIEYGYFDESKKDFIIINEGFIETNNDFSEICIGIFPNIEYSSNEFPKGMIAIVSSNTFEEAKEDIDMFWEPIM